VAIGARQNKQTKHTPICGDLNPLHSDWANIKRPASQMLQNPKICNERPGGTNKAHADFGISGALQKAIERAGFGKRRGHLKHMQHAPVSRAATHDEKGCE
jgi:hypothetical protein